MQNQQYIIYKMTLGPFFWFLEIYVIAPTDHQYACFSWPCNIAKNLLSIFFVGTCYYKCNHDSHTMISEKKKSHTMRIDGTDFLIT
jgi:hypothetical protein